ncbi:MAG: cupin domain-containing protein [Alphaproteobacteria bacterium]|nr:cupin domain-containing protein [Alphaproteobacteria bacterium]
MSELTQTKQLDFTGEMRSFIGRHTDKSFDWDAFPGSRGFPELERAQMRYIGAGGSPKADDPGTLKPGQFTLSLVHQPVGKYAACHSHEVVEHFLVLQGVLTVGWAWGDEVIEARLGPNDMVLNKAGRPHGFRNDGVEPVLMSISVGTGAPKPPVYVCHPRDSDPQTARRFGAAPGKTRVFDVTSRDPHQQEFARHIVRSAAQRPVWNAGLARLSYIGGDGAPPGGYSMEMIHLPKGVAVCGYTRPAEDAYFVLEGCVTVGWEESGHRVEERLGPKDVIWNPAGRMHYFRNDGVADAQFLLLAGTSNVADVRFQAA